MMEQTATSGNLSRKVISIAAGEAHTLALSGDGKLYSWGRGTFGRLGTGSEADQPFPVLVKFFGSDADREEKLRIVGIAAGAYHSLALADDGSVWGWGYNIYGQIGGTGENSLVPCLLEGFLGLGPPGSATKDYEMQNGKPLKISSVKAGGMMSMAIDSLGSLWMWGNFPHPLQSQSVEGQIALVSSASPVPIWNFHGHTVVKVACGNEHVVALVSAGETYEANDLICYSWGGNNHGQLGLGDNESRLSPEVIEAFNLGSPWSVYEISCGAYHTALLALSKGSSDILESVCFTFGLGDNGQLGHGTTQSLLSPELVHGLPQNTFLTSVDCGLFHTCVVSSAGDVWSWGMEKGLGLCPDARFTGTDSGDASSPLLIPCSGMYSPRFQEPLQVACGAAHTVLVADSGYKIWSWGRGRSGVLGNGKMVDCYAPTISLWPTLVEDFKEQDSNNARPNENYREKNPEHNVEMEKRLSAAMEEMAVLRSKLSVMERYASMLHGSIFGKPFQEQEIPPSIQSSGAFDIAKEWDNMLESSDQGKLLRLEMFYKDMLASVKDKLLKRRIQDIVKECLKSTAARSTG
ncbi:ultraviolet-B receptor UVR8 isoform X2 [Primulina tabacum]|uniref:ultraviolet-B receptor UVR8 isoform X2 n=1 Tax=Primulina tabacum TaxID=48773 RepID=UPI003F5AB23A